MGSRRSVEEQLLDPEQYELEAKDDNLGVAQKQRGGFLVLLATCQCLQLRHVWHVVQRLKALLPSFVLASGRKQHAVVLAQLKATSYMDGLRGIACWCVFVGHVWRPWMNYPNETDNWDFGFTFVPGGTAVILFPILRAIYSGTFMVQIFFVLSGYVLSLKPLALIRSQSSESLLDYLSAAAFRRTFRLFLPVVAARFFVTVAIYCGSFGTNFIGVDFQPAKDSIWLQLDEYLGIVLSELNPFRWDRQEPPYMAQLWTISVEFRGSIVVYIILLATTNIRPIIRLASLSLFVLFCMSIKMWDIADFVCGMLLAEAALIRRDSGFDLAEFLRKYSTPRALERLRAVFWTLCNIVAIWLGTYPLREGNQAWSYVWYTNFIPAGYQESDWWRAQYSIFCGSVLLLVALENYKPLQRPYTTVVAQYLGKISFSLYIVHQPLAFSFNRELARYFFGVIPNHVVAYCVAMVAVSMTTLWVADVFWRLVDVKSIQAARVIRKWCEVR